MYKAVMAFSQSGVGGWTELMYSNSPDALTCLAELDTLATKRAALLGSDGIINFLRVKNLNAPFEGLIKRVDKPGNSTNNSDTPWQACYFALISAGGHKRSYKTPGIPDGQIIGGIFTPDATFNSNFIIFQNQLVGTPWQLRIRDTSQPRIDIGGVDINGNLTTLQPATAPTPWVVGDKIGFYRTTDTVGFPVVTTHKILSTPDSTHFLLQGWKPGRIVNKGQVVRQVFVFDTTATYGLPNVSLRRVGRPLGLLRGRRSTRR